MISLKYPIFFHLLANSITYAIDRYYEVVCRFWQKSVGLVCCVQTRGFPLLLQGARKMDITWN